MSRRLADSGLQADLARFLANQPIEPVSKPGKALKPPKDILACLRLADEQHAAGNLTEAIALYKHAIKLRPEVGDLHNNLGVIYKNAGKMDDAIICLQRAFSLNPRSEALGNNLASMLIDKKRYDEADKVLSTVLAAHPESGSALSNFSLILESRGKVEEAMAICRKAITLDPENYVAHHNLVHFALTQERPLECLASCLKMIEKKPNDPLVYRALGSAMRASGQPGEALIALNKSLELAPNIPETYHQLVPCLCTLEKFDEALHACLKLMELAPNASNTYCTFALALTETGQWNEAMSMCGKAIELAPDNPNLYHVMARIAHMTCDLETAKKLCEKTIELDPNRASTRWDRALVMLLQGDLENGWKEFEWRWKAGQVRPDEERLTSSARRWEGEPLAGHSILIQAEQGIGDTIQFARYIPILLAMGAKIYFQVQNPLKTLFRNMPGVEAILDYNDPVPAHDFFCPTMSLPNHLGTRLDNIPPIAPLPPLPSDLIEKWHMRISDTSRKLRVGLVWAGNPKHRNDVRRSIRLEHLRPLLEIPDIRWFSVQVGPRESDLQELPSGLIKNLAPDLTDFRETAAALNELDLLISVDTSTAHLAGTMGLPTWLILPYSPDWRWLMHRTDSVWYPSMRLFRQGNYRDWPGVVDQLRTALQAVLEAKKNYHLHVETTANAN